MNDKPKFACPECGADEFVTPLNSWDKYQATGDKLCWQKTDLGHDAFELRCRECGERAPVEFESAAK